MCTIAESWYLQAILILVYNSVSENKTEIQYIYTCTDMLIQFLFYFLILFFKKNTFKRAIDGGSFLVTLMECYKNRILTGHNNTAWVPIEVKTIFYGVRFLAQRMNQKAFSIWLK